MVQTYLHYKSVHESIHTDAYSTVDQSASNQRNKSLHYISHSLLACIASVVAWAISLLVSETKRSVLEHCCSGEVSMTWGDRLKSDSYSGSSIGVGKSEAKSYCRGDLC
uniref:Uncharacterized protein n=1 Tax=Oryza brachyantha TaxID=4533 RepID=J3LD81_ORYBR